MVTRLSNKDRDIQEAYDRGSIPASMETFPYFSSHCKHTGRCWAFRPLTVQTINCFCLIFQIKKPRLRKVK